MRFAIITCLGFAAVLAAESSVQVYGTKLVVSAPTYNRSPELARLLNQKVTVDFQDTGFDDAVAFLRNTCNVNFILGPDALVDAPPIDLKLEDVPLASVLRWMRTLTKVDYHLIDGAVYFTNQPIPGKMQVKIYDVADVVMRVPHFEGPALNFGSGGDVGIDLPMEVNEGDAPWSTEELADIIRTSLEAQ